MQVENSMPDMNMQLRYVNFLKGKGLVYYDHKINTNRWHKARG